MSAGTSSKNNRTLGIALGFVVAGMVAMAFAAVPLYELFCRVTGYGGTTQIAGAAPDVISEREITIRFDANTAPGLAWDFGPEEKSMPIRVGESGLAFYKAANIGDAVSTGVATFNVTPLRAGKYFNKVACFCFNEQALDPGEEMLMGVSFFVDPAMLDDRDMDTIETITLSYTFFAAPGEEETAAQSESGTLGQSARLSSER